MSQTTASDNAIHEFEKVAVQCSLMEATAVINFENGEILEVTACVEPNTQYKKFFVRAPGEYIRERFHSLSLVEVIEEAGRRFGHGTLQVAQIKAIANKSPVSKSELRTLAVGAFCKAFGLPIPTEQELKEMDKASKTNLDELKQSYLEFLHGAAEGVANWNKLTPKELVRFSYKRSDLRDLKLENVRLIGNYNTTLDMQGSWFDRSNLSGAQIEFCDLSKGSFKNANCAHVNSHSGRGKLSDCDFTSADLTGATLDYTNLNRALFNNACLSNATLNHASLKGASFTNADLSGAELAQANLRGADLSDATYNDQTIFTGCEYDEETKFPADFSSEGRKLKWKGTGRDPLQGERAKIAGTVAGDFDAFMKQLKSDIDKSRLDKALKMLKAERFQLFAEVSKSELIGVVKSQTDPDLLYACRLTSDGDFSCCTQNLFACGGLRGALCKHLLVLLIGLAKAKEIDSTNAYEWAMSSGNRKPKLDGDTMSDTFLRYKAAETGDIDWRPTETTPEDYYAF